MLHRGSADLSMLLDEYPGEQGEALRGDVAHLLADAAALVAGLKHGSTLWEPLKDQLAEQCGASREKPDALLSPGDTCSLFSAPARAPASGEHDGDKQQVPPIRPGAATGERPPPAGPEQARHRGMGLASARGADDAEDAEDAEPARAHADATKDKVTTQDLFVRVLEPDEPRESPKGPLPLARREPRLPVDAI